MSVKNDFPTVCNLLELWGIGDVDSELSDPAKIRHYVAQLTNPILEQITSEFQEAVRDVEAIYQELGAATYWRFISAKECAAKLTPILNELLLIRNERYKRKER